MLNKIDITIYSINSWLCQISLTTRSETRMLLYAVSKLAERYTVSEAGGITSHTQVSIFSWLVSVLSTNCL